MWRRDIHAGHWSPFSHPQVLARSVHELVDFLEGKPASRALLRAQVGRPREEFGDTLVSVTGAGSGIGRATALEFARLGAEVVVSDIDEAGVRTPPPRSPRAAASHMPYTLDVADADAVERFAEQVSAEHGVPDVVVNNAGVGHAGLFLDTPARSMTGYSTSTSAESSTAAGHLGAGWSIAGQAATSSTSSSMAAYSPQQSMNAYATSKAAVFMFGDCLRAELDQAGVGLTTVCPGVINTNIVHTTRFDVPADKADKVRSASRPDRQDVRRSALRSGEGRQGHRVGGQEKQADPAGRARGVLRLRRRASAAPGDAQFRARAWLLSVRPSRSSAMSSRTANIVRVGTPVPPLPV